MENLIILPFIPILFSIILTTRLELIEEINTVIYPSSFQNLYVKYFILVFVLTFPILVYVLNLVNIDFSTKAILYNLMFVNIACYVNSFISDNIIFKVNRYTLKFQYYITLLSIVYFGINFHDGVDRLLFIGFPFFVTFILYFLIFIGLFSTVGMSDIRILNVYIIQIWLFFSDYYFIQIVFGVILIFVLPFDLMNYKKNKHFGSPMVPIINLPLIFLIPLGSLINFMK